jgi:hypothetical protein
MPVQNGQAGVRGHVLPRLQLPAIPGLEGASALQDGVTQRRRYTIAIELSVPSASGANRIAIHVRFGLFDGLRRSGCEPTPASVDVNAHDDVSVPVVDVGDALSSKRRRPDRSLNSTRV